MTKFLLSPAERKPISNLGLNSPLPEQLGVDILWQGLKGMAGAQRKTQMDLIASVRDERLSKELEQIQQLTYRFLILEGHASWTQDGKLNSPHVQWSLRKQWGVETRIQTAGVVIIRTRTELETCAAAEYLYERTNEDHEVSSLLARSNNGMKNGWGKVTDRAYCIHLLSGFEGVGKVLAERMWEKHGSAPIGLKMTPEELLEIEGVGPKKLASILRAFGISPGTTNETPDPSSGAGA